MKMANICEKVGADAPEVMTGIGSIRAIVYSFLNAGIGWGGSCFGKDVQSLMHIAGDYGYQAATAGGFSRCEPLCSASW